MRLRAAVRVALSYYVANGLVGAIGLLVISGGVQLWLGSFAASAASVGVIVCIPPDQAAPRRRKLMQLLPAAVIGPPLFFSVHALHGVPLYVGLLLVPATFVAFLGGAWGKRGLPTVMSAMFAMIFSLAVPEHLAEASALTSTLYFTLGEVLYLAWATLANSALNERYRVQMLADTFLALATLIRTEAEQLVAPADASDGGAGLIGVLLKHQAALADQIQAARNIVLEAPRTPRREQLAAMLLQTLEMRDHLVACQLDLDILISHRGHAAILGELRAVMLSLAEAVEALADALLFGRQPALLETMRPRLEALHWGDDAAPATAQAPAAAEALAASKAPPTAEAPAAPESAGPSPETLARAMADRIGHVNDEVLRLIALARGEQAPDAAVVRSAWKMFVSPTAWSWKPFTTLWHWDAPPLRHAIRAALAVGTAYVAALYLPWGTHDYWILLTIVVVLRGSLAQTLERRDSRVAGTLLGCVLVGLLLWTHPPLALLMVTVTLAQAVAHAFAARRYLVTAVAATILGLVQAHLLSGTASPVFDMAERMGDTLMGAAFAWLFSYVLPAWERRQIPELVKRTVEAQARHAGVALRLGLPSTDDRPEIEWRLARRDAYDSLSALVQAAQRTLFEPRAVRPPLEPLDRLLAHSYQLLAQLTAVKTMLLLRRADLNIDMISAPLAQTAKSLEATLMTRSPRAAGPPSVDAARETVALPDPFEHDISPWLLRRLRLAGQIAVDLREDAAQVLAATAA